MTSSVGHSYLNQTKHFMTLEFRVMVLVVKKNSHQLQHARLLFWDNLSPCNNLFNWSPNYICIEYLGTSATLRVEMCCNHQPITISKTKMIVKQVCHVDRSWSSEFYSKLVWESGRIIFLKKIKFFILFLNYFDM